MTPHRTDTINAKKNADQLLTEELGRWVSEYDSRFPRIADTFSPLQMNYSHQSSLRANWKEFLV
jgi:hypothetical protein